MKRIAPIAIAAVIALVPLAATADDFFDACMLGASPGSGTAQSCACMSPKIPAGVRADATEALRRTSGAIDASKPVDPSTLPPNLMRGLQAVVVAQSECM